MSRSYLYLVLLLPVFLCNDGLSQETKIDQEQRIEQVIESLVSSSDAEVNASVILEDLTRYAENPLDISSATHDELSRLHLFTYNQIQNIISYREKYGNIYTIYELQAIDGITKSVAERAAPFLFFSSHNEAVEGVKSKRLRHLLLTKGQIVFPLSRGYSSESDSLLPKYAGHPAKLYTRYRAEIPGLAEAGFTCENDAGESFFSDSNNGFDFYSGFISVKERGILQQLTVGDYRLGFGQGVNISSGFGMGKSSDVLNIMKGVQGVRPYTSADENNFFRGVASVFSIGKLRLTTFYSQKNRDANIVTDTVNNATWFTSLQNSGYHRTINEISDEKSLDERILGAYVEMNFRKFRFGVLSARQQFGTAKRPSTSLYKYFDFSDDEKLNFGLDYQLGLTDIQLFGELASGINGKLSGLQGMVWNPHPQFGLSAIYRHYDPEFHSIYGSAFSETAGNNNENGIYTGIEILPVAKVKLTFYVDMFNYPWLRSNTVAPGNGNDILFQIDYSPVDNVKFYLRGKREIKPSKGDLQHGIPINVDEITGKLRFNSEWGVSEIISVRFRGEYVEYNKDEMNENGFLAYSDIKFQIPSISAKLWLRYCMFNTDSYSSRVYAYENDILYNFYIPSYYGKGQRMYVNLSCRPVNIMTVYLKIGYTVKSGIKEWGSGYDVTVGNSRTDIKAMVRFKF